MRAGELRHALTIESPGTATRNDRGELIPGEWVTFATLRGSVDQLGGRELERARQTVATATHQIRTRYLAGVLTTFRVTFRGRAFAINDVANPGERGRELILTCTETKAAE